MWTGLTFHPGVRKLDNELFSKPKQVDYITGASLFVKREVWEKVGLLDPNLFYWEDIDFCVRSRKCGFEIWYVPSAKMWHQVGGTTGIYFLNFYMARSRILFMAKNTSLPQKLFFAIFFSNNYFTTFIL